MRARSVDSLSRALGDEIQRRIAAESERRTLMVRAALGQQWAVACSVIKPQRMINLRTGERFTEWGLWCRPTRYVCALAALPSPAEAVAAILGER
jgi:hypothetical protein